MQGWNRAISLFLGFALLVPQASVLAVSGVGSSAASVTPVLQGNADLRPRVALVIGNSRYTHIPPLLTAANDASDVALMLEKLGFEVTRLTEIDLVGMRNATVEFAAMLKSDRYRNALAVFYYAGHGTQSAGRNFLLPIDVTFDKNQSKFDEQALDVNEDIVQQFSRMAQGTRPGANIIILDACRDDPIGGRPGFSRLEVPSGTLLAFAAAAGQQAIDTLDRNKQERNGLYTRYLLEELAAQRRVDVERFFKILKRKVHEASQQRQDPLIMPNLIEDVYLEAENKRGSASGSAKGSPEELAAWKSIEMSPEACDFTTFLKSYPSGEFAESALTTLGEIRRKTEVTRRAFADLPDGIREMAVKAFKEKEAESDIWCQAKSADQPQTLKSYLEAYPNGRNAARARIRLATLEQREQEKRQAEVEAERERQRLQQAALRAEEERVAAAKQKQAREQDMAAENARAQQQARLEEEERNAAHIRALEEAALRRQAEASAARLAAETAVREAKAAATENIEFTLKLAKAEQGDSDAMYYLSMMYAEGAPAVKPDKIEMLKWLLMSSNLGNGLASHKLYTHYAGDLTGYAKSIKYRNLAIRQGYCGPPVLGNARGKGSASAACAQ